MGVEYYSFALFIAALICLIAILFKLLFTNVKRQRKLLDEKESSLLQLYRTVESIMDEFNDHIKTAMDDIQEHESRAAAHLAAIRASAAAPAATEIVREEVSRVVHVDVPSRGMTVDASRIRAASEVLERAERMIKSSDERSHSRAAPSSNDAGEVIQRLFDDPIAEPFMNGNDVPLQHSRRETILLLAEEGKDHAQIAKELGITQNEVKLVIELGIRT